MKIDPNQMVRYFAVGAFNTLIAYGVFSLLLRLGMHYTWATLLGGISAMLAGYKFMKELVFKSKSKHAFLKFILIFATMYFVNIFTQFVARKTLNPYIAGAVASLVCALLSYFLNRIFVFRTRNPSLGQHDCLE
jgi:putative flippase GtrA